MSSEKKNRGIIIFLILVTSTISFLAYQNVKDLKVLRNAFNEEKEALEHDLDKIISDYDNIIDKNVKLESNINEKRLMILNLRDSLKNLKETDFTLIKNYRKKILELEEENRILFLKIDYLNKTNTNLLTENEKFIKELNEKEKLASKLQVQNESLNVTNKDLKDKFVKASEVEIAKVQITAMKKKSDEKYTETNKFKRTDIFKIILLLKENRITRPVGKRIYVSLLGPDDKIISKRGSLSLFDKTQVPYSSFINYVSDNSNLSLSSFIEVDRATMKKGLHKLKFYADSCLIDTKSITLK